MRTLAVLRIPEFPAWVRRWLAPSERLVALHARGRIVSACAELTTRGIAIGDSLARARALLPEAVFHEHDPRFDAAVWDDVLTLLADVAPHLRPVREGMALLAPFDPDALIALNRSLGGSLGMARTPLVATLAACDARAGAVLAVSEHEEERFLARASVRGLAAFGIDEELIARLEMFGLATVARVMTLTRRHLAAQFGPAGTALFDLVEANREASPVPLYHPPPSVTVSYPFEMPACEPRELVPVLGMLVVQSAERLGGLAAQTLTLRLDGVRAQGTRTARRVLQAPIADARPLRVAAEAALRSMMGERIDVVTMTLRLGGLAERRGVQAALFDSRPALADVVRKIHRRFPGRLLRAVILDRDAYLPECAARFEPYPSIIPSHSP